MLGINYVAVGFGLLLLWAWVAPGFAVALITKPVPPPPGLPSAKIEGIKVKVTKVIIGRHRLMGKIGDRIIEMNDNALMTEVVLEVRNTGPEPITYRSWRNENTGNRNEPGRMVDDRASNVRVMEFTSPSRPIPPIPDGGVREIILTPGQSTSDVLLFGAPEPKFQRLELYLPGRQVGKPAGAVDKPDGF